MLIGRSMGTKDEGLRSEAPIQFTSSPCPEDFTATGIPTPPPPPPPNLNFSGSSGSLLQRFDTKRRSRLRNFNWEAIPLEKVKGRPSLWSSETFQGELQIDTGRMEELFGKQDKDIQIRSPHLRRSLSHGDAQMNKVFLLDSRRSMNIGIFLKQFKRSATQIVEDIKTGNGEAYSSERLSELVKHLPEREEVKRLKSFQGDRERLSEADQFMLLLSELPNYSLRLEAMILKKDFHAVVLSLLSTARELKGAAEEILHCTELHYILRLVLKAGNFMNAGGYAGNAAGFRVSSLLKLADTKANKPGMNLLHFVVMEVQKKDPKFISFADRLQHVNISSRLSEDGLIEEFCKLQSRVTSMHQTLRDPETIEIKEQMDEFLEYAEEQIMEVQKEIEALQSSRQMLLEFLCEDEESFHLEECCKVFSCFCQKFQLAIKENKIRELEEQRRQQWEKKRLEKRHSVCASSSPKDCNNEDELELTLERNLRNARKPASVRLCRKRSLGSSCPATPKPQRSEKIQGYCDQMNAREMREVSERVLMHQMGYTVCRDVYKANAVSAASMHIISARTTSQSIAQIGPPSSIQLSAQIESQHTSHSLIQNHPQNPSESPAQNEPWNSNHSPAQNESQNPSLSPTQTELQSTKQLAALAKPQNHNQQQTQLEICSQSTQPAQTEHQNKNQSLAQTKLPNPSQSAVDKELCKSSKSPAPGNSRTASQPLAQTNIQNPSQWPAKAEAQDPTNFPPQNESPNYNHLMVEMEPVTSTQSLMPFAPDTSALSLIRSGPQSLTFGHSPLHSKTEVLGQSLVSSEHSFPQYLHAKSEEKMPAPPLQQAEPQQIIVQPRSDIVQQVQSQPGTKIHKQLLAEPEMSILPKSPLQRSDISQLFPPYSDGDNPEEILDSSQNGNPNQLLAQSSTDIIGQSLSDITAETLSHSPTQLGYKSLDKEFDKTNQLSSQNGTDTHRHSLVQYKHEAHINSLARIKPQKTSHLQETGVEVCDLSKIHSYVSTHLGTEIHDSTIAESGKGSLIQANQTGDSITSKVPLENPGLDSISAISDILEPNSHPHTLYHSRSKLPTQSVSKFGADICRPSVTQTCHDIFIKSVSVCVDETLKPSPVQLQSETTVLSLLQSGMENQSLPLYETTIQSPSKYGADSTRESIAQSEPEVTTAQPEPVTTIKSSTAQTGNHVTIMSLTQKRLNIPRQSLGQFGLEPSRKSLIQSTHKTAKQSLSHSVVKAQRQVTKPALKSPRQLLDQVGQETSSLPKSEAPKHSIAQSRCISNRIHAAESVSVRHVIKAKEINVQVPEMQGNSRETMNEATRGPRVRGIVECKPARGLKDVHPVVPRDSPNPCSKWKRELQNTCVREEVGKRESESGSPEAFFISGANSGDSLKKCLSTKCGSNVSKKSKNADLGFGVRRVHLTKEVSSGCIQGIGDIKQRISNLKQTQKETRDSKLPQRVSLSGTGKLPQAKGNIKEKTETLNPNTTEYINVSESKCNPSAIAKSCVSPSQKTVNGSLHNEASSREPGWTSQLRKPNNMARLAVHVIKNCEFNSSLPRATRYANLDGHPIWR
ncbi:uncharacterized protein LOC128503316 [Spea bombifrons]|uniref:uncharacterized protein LOC128503316 n=1 Tax=Spea bombifrons TaxID=233779 RepID=UPI002349BCDD|nr:uncharacterized protein LOC128503316 [Spea bombifrons]